MCVELTGHLELCEKMATKDVQLTKQNQWCEVKKKKGETSLTLVFCKLSTERASVPNTVLKECSTYWNAIKSARHFFKDSTLWSHFIPLHCPLLQPIMFPSKKKRRKRSITVIYEPAEPQQWLANNSGGLIASQQHRSSQKTSAVFAQCMPYYQQRMEGSEDIFEKVNDVSNKFHHWQTIWAGSI